MARQKTVWVSATGAIFDTEEAADRSDKAVALDSAKAHARAAIDVAFAGKFSGEMRAICGSAIIQNARRVYEALQAYLVVLDDYDSDREEVEQ